MKSIKSALRALTAAVGCMLVVTSLATRADAELLTYDIVFSGGPPMPTAGSFTYDTTQGLFTSFYVIWNGVYLDILPSANNPVTQNNGPQGVHQLFETLVNGGTCNGLPLENFWGVYPPNPPGNVFSSTFLIALFTSARDGILAGAGYPDPDFVAEYTSGTFLVVPAWSLPEAFGLLMDDIEEALLIGELTQSQADGLLDKLSAALASCGHGDKKAAYNQLRAFINQVSGLIKAGKILPVKGQLLIDAAEDIQIRILF